MVRILNHLHDLDRGGILSIKVSIDRAFIYNLTVDLQELGSTVRELEESGAKALVLTSAQPTVFCSGLDIM